jgi:hypothetical protein
MPGPDTGSPEPDEQLARVEPDEAVQVHQGDAAEPAALGSGGTEAPPVQQPARRVKAHRVTRKGTA